MKPGERKPLILDPDSSLGRVWDNDEDAIYDDLPGVRVILG